ncbi:MAG: orotidine-5'-phosphate decarboxylase [Sodaliphilus sp.]
MNRQELFEQIKAKRSFLCVGLDPDPDKMPAHLVGDVFAFNKAIIDATAPYAVAFKPNLAFYEANGVKGIEAFEKTVAYIRDNYPDIFIIADAKRGDIGNTSKMYAKCFFETMNVDALTVAPYMGEDSITPFLSYPDKWVVVLALTSNKGSLDFQHIKDDANVPLYHHVITATQKWGDANNMMYVCGATQAEMFTQIRSLAPHHFLLVPGVGAQGGSLEKVAKYGMNSQCGLLVNSSRGIIHASNSEDFAHVAAQKAIAMQQEMSKLLEAIL